MATYYYCEEDSVRRQVAMLADAIGGVFEFTDEDINYCLEEDVQPHINSKLYEYYTVPFTEDDSTGAIGSIARKLCAAYLVRGRIAQYSDEQPKICDVLIEEADKWLDEIISGKRGISHTAIAQELGLEYEDNPLEQPENSVFTGPPSDWELIDDSEYREG